METSLDCMTYRRLPSVRRRVPRALVRVSTFVLLLGVAALMLYGERWLIENNPTSVARVAAHAGKAVGTNGTATETTMIRFKPR